MHVMENSQYWDELMHISEYKAKMKSELFYMEEYPSWLKGPVLKTGRSGDWRVGSNPTSSASGECASTAQNNHINGIEAVTTRKDE